MSNDEDNADQIADWNGPQGRRWAELQAQTEGLVTPFGLAALQAAMPRAGEHVIDIGCGCGATSLKLAEQVGASGRVLGVDVSAPMLAVARTQAARSPWAGSLEFREADAAHAELPTAVDLLYSRFGVMFFAAPAAALRHLRASLRPDGRLVFVCWRTPRDNPWTMTPLAAARQAMGITPTPADPHAPGPFAFADEVRLRALLQDAGYAATDLQRCDALVMLGESPRAAAENAVRIGPTSRFARESGEHRMPEIVDAVERALTPLAAADGTVRLNGSTWVVTARNV